MRTTVVETPFPGSVLYVPKDGKAHPGIVILHGSEGGGMPFSHLSALRWANEGYSVMAYTYFGSFSDFLGPKAPLAQIEIQNLVKAIEWLKESPYVGGGKIALDGASRGGELALLTASLMAEEPTAPELSAVSVHSPADEVWASWNHDWVDERCWLGPVPSFNDMMVKTPDFQWNAKCGRDPREIPREERNAWTWKGKPLFHGERIAVEKIRAPIFLTHGLKDEIWPAEQSKRIEKVLIENGRTHEVVFFEHDGHVLSRPSAVIRGEKLEAFYRKYLGGS